MSREATPLFLVFDGSALEIVERCPATLDDFRSYEALGRPYDRRAFFKGVGVSMHTSHRRAIGARPLVVTAVGRGVVGGRSSRSRSGRVGAYGGVVVTSRSGRRRELLFSEAVVQCDEHE